MVAAPTVVLDQGVFKYILIKATARDTGEEVVLVRGNRSCECGFPPCRVPPPLRWLTPPWLLRCADHIDVLEMARGEAEVQAAGLIDLRCAGGGRMEHRPGPETLSIYGYSQQFGRADHELAERLCREHFEQLGKQEYRITTSNEGY